MPTRFFRLIAAVWPILAASMICSGQICLGQATALHAEQPEEPVDENQPTLVELLVSPAAAPHFALQRRLLPGYAERQPGNAAQFYYRSLLHRKNFAAESDKQYAENYERWLHWPPEAAALAEMKEWIKAYQGAVFGELKTAVYREQCDWDFRLRELKGLDPIYFLLEEMQESRALARALQVQARIQMAEGRMDDAVESIRMGFQLARDIAQPPTLINSLVGVAISSLMTVELQNLATLENSPNMYWAVSSLPHPMIDFRPSMEYEMGLAEQIFPFLKDAETAERSAEEWRRVVVESFSRMTQLDSNQGPPENQQLKSELGFAALAAVAYPRAKRALVEAGFPAEKVEAMPVTQVLAIQTARVTRYAYQETFKWSFLPYAEAHDQMDKSIQRLRDNGLLSGDQLMPKQGALPFAAFLLPGISQASWAPVRLERTLAATRIVEALRMFAAEHDGKLPATLDEIKIVPIPRDPLNNEPFSYRVEGDRAILDVPPRAGKPARQEGYRYVIQMRSK